MPLRLGALLLAALSAPSKAHADSPACGEAFDESQVRRDEGKLLAARRLLRTCGGAECSPTKQRMCSAWLADVDTRMPSVILSAKDASGADLLDVQVLMDGAPIATKLDGRAIDVDPGPHTFVFVFPDGTRAQATALAAERAKGTPVSVRDGEPERSSARSTPGAAPASAVHAAGPGARAVAPAEASPPAPSGGWSGWKTAGVVAGGAGVAGIALGAIFGVEAFATRGADCKDGLCVEGGATTAYRQGTISTVWFIAGGALLAAGVTLLLLGPRGAGEPRAAGVSLSPAIGPSMGGLQLAGAWSW